MTVDDAPAPTRRARRTSAPQSAGTSTEPVAHGITEMLTTAPEPLTPTSVASASLSPDAPLGAPVTTTLAVAKPTGNASRIALAWVDEDVLAHAPAATRTLAAAASPYLPVGADLLGKPPRRSPWRAGVIVPLLVVAALIGGYSATTLLWPLHAVPPVINAAEITPVAAAPAALTWPGVGSAAVSVAGIGGPVASSADAVQIASITKVVTALLVLDEMPLAVGEQGPEFRFTSRDSSQYWSYLENNESALDVPVGGSLSEYQMLQGMLIGSANNYADRLAGNLYPSDAVFAAAARTFLTAHGISGVTVVEPTGLDARNTASPEALIPLATLALANPVFAEIVATTSVDLPGAGTVTNTNGLLADPGVIGVKTGSLDSYNLLSAKNITVGDTTVRVYASVLGQPDDEGRLAASRQLYTDVEAALQPVTTVPKGTVTGHVTTLWGQNVAIVTADDARVILWNGAAPTATTSFALDDATADGANVGTLAVNGPLNATSTALELATDIEPPSAWWRLTHPLELFGLN